MPEKESCREGCEGATEEKLKGCATAGCEKREGRDQGEESCRKGCQGVTLLYWVPSEESGWVLEEEGWVQEEESCRKGCEGSTEEKLELKGCATAGCEKREGRDQGEESCRKGCQGVTLLY